MKIAMLAYSMRPRGGVVHAVRLSEALKAKGADVTLFSLRKRGMPEDYAEFFGKASFPVHLMEYNWHEDVKERLRRMTEAFVSGLPRDFDVYHAQDCVCDTALQMLAAEGSIAGPTVRTVHHIQGFPDPYIDACERSALLGNTEKITVSRYWQEELKSRCGMDSTLIHNGIDNGAQAARREPRILFVGGMEARKGLEFAIEALEVLAPKRKDLSLIAVARPGFLRTESKEWFDHLIERCGLSGRVEIKELITDGELARLYSSSSVFVLPTRMEGWGLAIMEAMAAGCPVVSSPVGGVTELISNGENGLLVSVGDVAGIAKAVETLLDDKNLRQRMCASAKATIGKYTWESCAEKTLHTYEKIIARH
jgi:glycosyltransferase involved in cell wall biosynthesis